MLCTYILKFSKLTIILFKVFNYTYVDINLIIDKFSAVRMAIFLARCEIDLEFYIGLEKNYCLYYAYYMCKNVWTF